MKITPAETYSWLTHTLLRSPNTAVLPLNTADSTRLHSAYLSVRVKASIDDRPSHYQDAQGGQLRETLHGVYIVRVAEATRKIKGGFKPPNPNAPLRHDPFYDPHSRLKRLAHFIIIWAISPAGNVHAEHRARRVTIHSRCFLRGMIDKCTWDALLQQQAITPCTLATRNRKHQKPRAISNVGAGGGMLSPFLYFSSFFSGLLNFLFLLETRQ